MTFGELRALPVGRGQIGRVKYLEVGRGVGRDRDRTQPIPASVIKTGVKLPQLRPGSLLLQEEDKPSLIQMRQELDQITSNISENPFMKNDMKRKDNYVAETREENELIPEKPAEEQEQGGQKDDLKKELTQVLKELRKSEEECEEGRLSKNLSDTESTLPADDNASVSDLTLPSSGTPSEVDPSYEEDIEIEVENEDNQDVGIEDEEVNKITENEEEEISAL